LANLLFSLFRGKNKTFLNEKLFSNRIGGIIEFKIGLVGNVQYLRKLVFLR
jgi:uncharacterized protein YkvS